MSGGTLETRISPGDLSRLRSYRRLKPGPGQSHLDVIASQRARLQRAIIELAGRDGIDAVTVRKLTKLAGVSTATFYSLFSGTDDCLLTTYRDIVVTTARRIAEVRCPDLGFGEQLDRALRALLAGLLADRDVARFALIEIYGGGPAALKEIDTRERQLEAALRGCIDRRGRRTSRKAIAAIFAGVLHCARVQLIGASSEESAETIRALIEWAVDVVQGAEEIAISAAPVSEPCPQGPTWDPRTSMPGERDEEDLILAAILRLAMADGFRGLDAAKVSSAAGLPAASFRRYFGNLADGYLAAIRRTCRSFFVELTDHDVAHPKALASIRTALQRASRRAARNPTAARLTFSQVVEPGVPGLTCRETLISELATAYSESTSHEARPVPVRAEARAAALWRALAQGAQAPSPAR